MIGELAMAAAIPRELSLLDALHSLFTWPGLPQFQQVGPVSLLLLVYLSFLLVLLGLLSG